MVVMSKQFHDPSLTDDPSSWFDAEPSITTLGMALLSYIHAHDPNWIAEVREEVEGWFTLDHRDIISIAGPANRKVGQLVIAQYGHHRGRFMMKCETDEDDEVALYPFLAAADSRSSDMVDLNISSLSDSAASGFQVGTKLSDHVSIDGLEYDARIANAKLSGGLMVEMETSVRPWREFVDELAGS